MRMSDSASYLQIDLDDGPDPVRLIARGEIDAASAETLEVAVVGAQEGAKGLTLDLAAVTFIDSSGLRVIATALQRAEEQGTELTIASPSDPVRRILDVTGFSDLIRP